MRKDFSNYLEQRIEEEEKKLSLLLTSSDKMASKKHNALLYQLKFIKISFNEMDIKSFKLMLEALDESLDKEIDSYLDIVDNIYNDEYYLSMIVKKTDIGVIKNQFLKIYDSYYSY